jgi:hypothetical protein
MLIYEKDNKLNINFDNEVSEQPDLQISKEDGKTSVTIDGQPGEGLPPATSEDVGKSVIVGEDGGYALGEAGGGAVICRIDTSNGNVLSMTHEQIAQALRDGKEVVFVRYVESPTRPISAQSNLISEVRERGNYKGIAVTFIDDMDLAASPTEINVAIYRILMDGTVSTIFKKITFS